MFKTIVQNLLLKILGGSPEHLFQISSVMLTPSFGFFLDVLTNCTHPQFTVASVWWPFRSHMSGKEKPSYMIHAIVNQVEVLWSSNKRLLSTLSEATVWNSLWASSHAPHEMFMFMRLVHAQALWIEPSNFLFSTCFSYLSSYV